MSTGWFVFYYACFMVAILPWVTEDRKVRSPFTALRVIVKKTILFVEQVVSWPFRRLRASNANGRAVVLKTPRMGVRIPPRARRRRFRPIRSQFDKRG